MKTSEGKYVNRDWYPNAVLVGILNREPALLDSLRSAFEEFWQEAKEAGVVEAGAEFPGLTAEDLPWFWSYEGLGRRAGKVESQASRWVVCGCAGQPFRWISIPTPRTPVG
jgi:hypothetical protein